MKYDVLIKGGRVIDPKQEIEELRDVALADGKVAAISRDIPASEAAELIDATGLIVTPGLIDMHVHAYPGVCCYGLEPDSTNIERGVTTVLDCGSAGARTFPAFRNYFIERADTKIYSLLNISSMGIISDKIGELFDMRWADVDEAVSVGKENRDVILGIKVRLSSHVISESNKIDALKRSIDAAEQIEGFVMVHVGDAETPLEKLTSLLRPGDIVTHAFRQHGGVSSINKEIVSEVKEARDFGVIFDVGHGRGSCSFETVEMAITNGFLPDVISSDLSSISIEGPVFDLVTTMSKFLHFGMSLNDVVKCVTMAPSAVMGLDDGRGSLSIGAVGDVTILRLEAGEHHITDAEGVSVSARYKISPVAVVKQGKRYKRWALGGIKEMTKDWKRLNRY